MYSLADRAAIRNGNTMEGGEGDFTSQYGLAPAPAASTVKPIQFPVGTPLPFIWGAQDAASGLICTPEMQFIRHCDQVNYAAGWASINGENETTRWFLGFDADSNVPALSASKGGAR